MSRLPSTRAPLSMPCSAAEKPLAGVNMLTDALVSLRLDRLSPAADAPALFSSHLNHCEEAGRVPSLEILPLCVS